MVGVTGNVLEVLCENQRRVCENQIDAVFENESVPRQIAAGKISDNGAAAEGVSELPVEGVKQVLIRGSRHIRQIHLDSCLFG